MSDIHRFSNWISDAQREWQPACVDLAVTAFIDAIVCMIAGSRDAGTLAAMRAVADIGGPVPIVCAPAGLVSPSAELIDRTAAHALDFDDFLEGANANASAVLVP